MNDNLIQKLAKQLRCPEDSEGIKLGHTMNMTNLRLVLNAIQHLNIQPHDNILELGQGNGGHLAYIFTLADDIHYTGLEISKTMHEESISFNQAYCNIGLANFYLYDGKNIPINEPSFNKAFTVNTIYFWDEPHILLEAIAKVLKKDGLFVLTFCDKTFMEKLPFTQYGFHLYDQADVKQLFSSHPFKLIHQETNKYKAMTKMGKLEEQISYTLVYQKQ